MAFKPPPALCASPFPDNSFRKPGAVSPDIALLSYDLRSSGVVRNMHYIAADLEAAGYGCEIVTVHLAGEFLERMAGFSCVALSSRPSRSERWLETLAAVIPFRRYLEARRPRLLLSMGSHIHPLAALGMEGLFAPPKLIMRASNDVRRDTGNAAFRMLAAPAMWMAHRSLRRVYERADLVAAVSEELAADMLALGITRPGQTIAIRNGIDVERVQRAARMRIHDPWFAADAPPVLTGMGRIAPQKDFAAMLRAFAAVRRTRPVRFMILGAGKPEAVAALEAMARDLGVAEDVRLMGFVADPEPYLAASRCFLSSSRWEGMSNALLEALACGVDIAATRCPGGTVELLEHAPRARLVPAGDPAAMARAILNLLDTAPDRDAQQAHVRAFDLEETVSRYRSAAETLLTDGRFPIPEMAAPGLSAE